MEGDMGGEAAREAAGIGGDIVGRGPYCCESVVEAEEIRLCREYCWSACRYCDIGDNGGSAPARSEAFWNVDSSSSATTGIFSSEKVLLCVRAE